MLYSDFEIKKGIFLKNRLVMSPLALHFDKRGKISANEALIIIEKGKQCGLVVIGSHSVTNEALAYEGGWSVENGLNGKEIQNMLEELHDVNTKVILQLYFNGKEFINKSLYSLLSIHDISKQILQMSKERINEIIDGFAEATRQAINAGFDGIEIHGANSFLIQRFLSPLTNKRDDNWGGSPLKRAQLLLNIVKKCQEIRNKLDRNNFIIGCRLLPEEMENGIQFEDTLIIIENLSQLGVDYIHWSLRKWNQRSHGKMILKEVNEKFNEICYIGSGSIESNEDCMRCLKYTPLISMGRAILLNLFPRDSRQTLFDPQYINAVDKLNEFINIENNLTYSVKLSHQKKVFGPITTFSGNSFGNISIKERNFFKECAKKADVIILGSMATSRDGNVINKGWQIYNINNINGFKSFNRLIHQQSCLSIAQLYEGRMYAQRSNKFKNITDLIIAGDQFCEEDYQLVIDIFEKFICAANMAIDSDFDGIELNLTGPYFLGQIFNQRKVNNWNLPTKILENLLIQINKSFSNKEKKKNFFVGLKINSSICKNFNQKVNLKLLENNIDYLNIQTKDHLSLESQIEIENIRSFFGQKLIYIVSGQVRNEYESSQLQRQGLIPAQTRSFIQGMENDNVLLPDGLKLAKNNSKWFNSGDIN